MPLSAKDYESPVWLRFKEDAEARLADLRKQNDSDKTAEDTARIRGQIRELKYWLDRDRPAPAVNSDHA